jgi:hypothetical protein
MISKISDCPIEFIEHSIKRASEAFSSGEFKRETLLGFDSDLTNAYFAGATLCLDVKDAINDIDVITICHSDETYGYFSGGPRRLLSIKALKDLEELMIAVNVNHETKWILKQEK